MLLSNLDLLATAPVGVTKLRELILTLAVQGKLVPQDPADEPAGVLLQKIRAEKDRLIAEGKIKRDKPLAEIAEEEKPFGLPLGWEWVRLGSTMEMLNGRAFKPSEWIDAGLPIVRIQNLNNPNASFNYCDPSTVSEKNLIHDGAFLISWSGTPGTSFGAFIWNRGAAALNQHIFKCVLIGSVFSSEFLRLSINSQLNVLIAQAQGGVGLQHVTKGVLENLVLVLPPLAEQSRIVTRVEALMRLCDALEAKGQLEAAQHAQLVSTLLGTLIASNTPDELAANWQRVAQHFDLLLDRPQAIDALEQTLLQLAVRGLLVPQDPTDEPASALLQKIRAEKDRLIATGQIKKGKPLPPITDEEKPFELPAGWEWVRLGDAALRGPSNGLSPRPQELPTDVRCLSLSATTQGFFKPECFKYVDFSSQAAQQFFLKNGDLLIQRGNSLEYVGIAAIYDGPDDAYIYPDLMMRLQLSTCVKTEFIHIMLVCADGRSYFQRNATGTQGTMPKVNQATVAGAPIPLPPLAEQSRIVTRVTALRRLCANLRQRLAERQSVQARLAEALVDSVAA
ncbi:MAG: restriction endonuclease subunit S [Gammaproteobacteria bacterium]|nr:restriction endonuclease subunit S [Gammaproteobacteria bacterium]MBU1507389.1 restriction endonuclease subunit S [Gammaproteobacteria bacterium]MBU2122804.1 restriction endonuclease subunit S [Gammaproteobacteria bacterium]MBU2170547.1 restriction endonuclease subunit S [Gammaproteobacteria bacterium]MBU2202322.1 restriction endonuclease subunit S [Gammaproteobacteria bacterium]